MKTKEIKKLDIESVRKVCIENNWFTCGTSKQYDAMLMKVDQLGEITSDDLLSVAQEILEHSNAEKELKAYECTEKEYLLNMICKLNAHTYSYFEFI